MRRAAIRRGTRNPVWRLDRRFAKIRSAAKLAASSGLWRQPTLFGIHIVPRADWTTFVMRLETSNEGEGKKSLPRADDLSPGGACLRPWANQSDVALRATIPANTGGGTLPVSPRLASTESGRLHPPKGQITILLIFGVFKNTKPGGR